MSTLSKGSNNANTEIDFENNKQENTSHSIMTATSNTAVLDTPCNIGSSATMAESERKLVPESFLSPLADFFEKVEIPREKLVLNSNTIKTPLSSSTAKTDPIGLSNPVESKTSSVLATRISANETLPDTFLTNSGVQLANPVKPTLSSAKQSSTTFDKQNTKSDVTPTTLTICGIPRITLTHKSAEVTPTRVTSNTNTPHPSVSKSPRRKPGARECMQISRRFGANAIPQHYTDILLVRLISLINRMK